MKIEKFHLNVESLTTRPHLSSSTSSADSGDMRADRRFLAVSETNNDGEGTNMITTSRRIDLWHKRDRLLPGLSTSPIMAATTALRRYANDVRLVKLKQRAQEAPTAHLERVGVKSRAG